MFHLCSDLSDSQCKAHWKHFFFFFAGEGWGPLFHQRAFFQRQGQNQDPKWCQRREKSWHGEWVGGRWALWEPHLGLHHQSHCTPTPDEQVTGCLVGCASSHRKLCPWSKLPPHLTTWRGIRDSTPPPWGGSLSRSRTKKHSCSSRRFWPTLQARKTTTTETKANRNLSAHVSLARKPLSPEVRLDQAAAPALPGAPETPWTQKSDQRL